MAIDKVADYCNGVTTTEECNEALEKLGSTVRFDENKNMITHDELAQTSVGATAADANGWGLLYMGIGSPEKVECKNGVLVDCDMGAADAQFVIGGKTYNVEGSKLTTEIVDTDEPHH